jgi:ADP-L-glycero-D-manno-heptose 6-epimerase
MPDRSVGNSRAIVTGGAGFIGSNLVAALNERGVDDVVVVDDLTDGRKARNLSGLRISDYIDRHEFLARLESFADATVVFHQGACTDTTERDGRYMMATNYEYSRALLDFCQRHATPLIYASSAAVYGDGSAGFREEPECERPLNVYALSKLLFDNEVRRRLPGRSAQIVGLRYFNVYGPNEDHKDHMASVIRKFFTEHRADRPIELFEGSDDFRRDFVSVRDAVAVNLFFLDDGAASGIFNVGTGRARSFVDVVEAFRTAVGEPVRVHEVPFPGELRGAYQAFTQADLTSLRAAGYDRPFVDVEEGVAEYVRILKERAGGA